VVILAAGKGTRMKNPEMTKVMYPIEGKPMVAYVVELAVRVGAGRVLLVVGWKKETVVEYFSGDPAAITFVSQDRQLGTGHAVQQTAGALADFAGDVLVLSGDVPLLTEKTLRALLGYHRTTGPWARSRRRRWRRRIPDRPEQGRERPQDRRGDVRAGEKITEINSGSTCSRGRSFPALAHQAR
jgi:NDP-sugar pyrophosphorylase family protein